MDVTMKDMANAVRMMAVDTLVLSQVVKEVKARL